MANNVRYLAARRVVAGCVVLALAPLLGAWGFHAVAGRFNARLRALQLPGPPRRRPKWFPRPACGTQTGLVSSAFLYVVWILDPTQPEDACCREWVACFLIEASMPKPRWPGATTSVGTTAPDRSEGPRHQVEEPDEAAWHLPMIVVGQSPTTT